MGNSKTFIYIICSTVYCQQEAPLRDAQSEPMLSESRHPEV